MLVPVRCFTCGKVLGDVWERFIMLEKKLRTETNRLQRAQGLEWNEVKHDGEAMDELCITRYCCRRMLMSHVDLLEKILRCGLKEQKKLDEAGLAWWSNYVEQEEKVENFEWLVAKRKNEGLLKEDYEYGQAKGNRSSSSFKGIQSDDASAKEDGAPFGERFQYSDISRFQMHGSNHGKGEK